MTLAVGQKATRFTLPDTEGREHSLREGQPAVVVFTCNHCPYALAWHDRIAQAARDYPDVRFFAINPNDAERYPADSYERMRQFAREQDWPIPYLYDESQEVARAYGARTTPHVFVLAADGTVRYAGAPDADYRDEGQGARWLREALDAVLAGEEPGRPETEPVGCSVKWRT